MTLDALQAHLAAFFARPMPPLSRDTPLCDIPGWDSVSHISLLLSLERTCGQRIPAANIFTLQTLGDLLDALSRTP